ncbi:hypothetical protein EDD86DRAFT_202634 [Gorgonomyces haynaldii]|nr:hypothetical protein EDD86DRAFT_202634 [Gorgonomyces haynaldii]
MSIFVLGATGTIGQPLVKFLVEKKVQVTCYVRTLGKGKALLPNEVNLVEGDLEDEQEFRQAVKGHERLFILTNSYKCEPHLAKIACEEGIKHIVKISCVFANASYDSGSIFHSHGVIEAQLLKLPVSVTILRPMEFMENLILTSLGSIKDKGTIYRNHGDACVASIHAEDIALVAACVLTEPIDKHASLTYTLTGPEAVTKKELAQLISQTIQKPVSCTMVSDAQLMNLFRGYGMTYSTCFALVNLGQTYRLYLANNRFTNDNVEMITGQKPRTWVSFLKEHKKMFLE